MRAGTIITTNYLEKAAACLRSLPNCGVPAFCITYGFRATPALQTAFPGLQWYYLPPDQPGDCQGTVQHGVWLNVEEECFPDPEELVIIGDADAVYQRPLTDQEKDFLDTIDTDSVGLGYNAGPDDTLSQEIKRVYKWGPNPPWHVLEWLFPGITQSRCFNCGLIAARIAFWRRLRDAFLEYWPAFSQLIGPHPAKCQTLTCWIVQHVLHARIVELPYTIHMQGHYPLPEGGRITLQTAQRSAQVFYQDKLVWFAHHFPALLGWGN